ncbi:MAG: hypothetical protein ABEI53_01860 [Candidatus Magasanikbacteria bacterium]
MAFKRGIFSIFHEFFGFDGFSAAELAAMKKKDLVVTKDMAAIAAFKIGALMNELDFTPPFEGASAYSNLKVHLSLNGAQLVWGKVPQTGYARPSKTEDDFIFLFNQEEEWVGMARSQAEPEPKEAS